jgi:hypothetical protein
LEVIVGSILEVKFGNLSRRIAFAIASDSICYRVG